MTIRVLTSNTTVQNGAYDEVFAVLDGLTLSEAGPDTNYYTGMLNASDHTVGQYKTSLLSFGNINAGASPIPAGKQIDSATLYLYLKDAYGTGRAATNIQFCKVKDGRPWEKETATWNNYKTGSPWQVAGGTGTNDISAPGAWTTFDATVELTYIAIDFTSMVDHWYTGEWANMGALLKLNTDDALNISLTFTDKWATDGTRPELFITYSDATTNGTATPSGISSSGGITASNLLANSTFIPAGVSATGSVVMPVATHADTVVVNATVEFS